MKIGIDARFFGPVGKGLGRYTQRLIEHLEQLPGDDEFVVFLRKENYDAYRPASPRFRKALADFRWYSLEEQLRFPPLIAKEGIELMHFPHFNVPVRTPCPFVVTIHDLILLRHPTRRASSLNAATYWLKYAAYRFVIRRAAKRARKIITVSECTKHDIVRALGVKAEEVVVTYEASDPPLPPQPDAKKKLAERGIVRPYLLYVGNAYPHKNLERLVDAFGTMRKEGLDAQLVLVGKEDYFYRRLAERVRAAGLIERSDIVFYGFAEDRELAELYRSARLYVFPSLLEGFGLPPLEAMRYGTPVAASGSSCLPEILDGAATYFDPEDPEAMRRAIVRAFTDDALRKELISRAPAVVERYRWSDCAERTYAVYRTVTHA